MLFIKTQPRIASLKIEPGVSNLSITSQISFWQTDAFGCLEDSLTVFIDAVLFVFFPVPLFPVFNNVPLQQRILQDRDIKSTRPAYCCAER